MAWENPVTTWGQAGKTVPGAGDFNRIEGNIETLGRYDRAPGYGTATGINAKTITLEPAPTSYYDGMCFAFKNVTQNTRAVTINVNGLGARPIKKPNGKDLVAGNLKAGSIYTVRYNGTNFILQGSDSSGDAMPEHVLAGKTFSNDDDIDLIGTMPNIGIWAQVLRNQNQYVYIPKGYHNGEGVVAVDIQNLVPENIKEGVNVGGVIGTLFDVGEPRYSTQDNRVIVSSRLREAIDKNGGSTTTWTVTCNKKGHYRLEGKIDPVTTYSNQTFRIKMWINNELVIDYETVVEDNDPPYPVSRAYTTNLNDEDTVKVQLYCSHRYNPSLVVDTGFKVPSLEDYFI